MSRAVILLISRSERERAARLMMRAPEGSSVEVKGPKRTVAQNSRFWSLLTDIAQQVRWHGLKLTTGDWKAIFLDALKREMRIVPNLDGSGFVNIGQSSSDLSVREMASLMDLIEKFGAEHGVWFHAADDTEAA